jgi:membrane protease YdiL (CAAX protease family)
VLAVPLALAWLHHETPPPYAVACAGLSAFGPLFAVLLVAGRRQQIGAPFGPWRTHPAWVLAALFTPMAIHVAATAVFAALGGEPARWLHPPRTPEAMAALVVFPLGEEFGWRGFAHPRMVERYGLVKGSLVLGAFWGLWHLVYSITPEGRVDGLAFGIGMAELPLYSLLIAWVFERTHRSMAVAIAFHAGAHLDHLEMGREVDLRLHALHLAIVAALATFAAKSMARS